MNDAPKPKLAFYWCASCGGCEQAVLDLHEGLLELTELIQIVLWPIALDFKVPDIDRLADASIRACFINGAIRTDEQLDLAQRLRRKSELLIALGSCAHTGGVPGLANLTHRDAILRAAYLESPTVDNPEGILPADSARVGPHTLELPRFWSQVHALDQAVPVDYYIPGCAPPATLVQQALQRILGDDLPPRGSVLAPEIALCDSCPRRDSKNPALKLERLHRPHEVIADPELCFIDQGIICCGPATRSGCDEACIRGNMPCTGCLGPPPGVTDQGAKMLTTLASLIDPESPGAAQALESIVDPAGTFSRYAVPTSLLAARVDDGDDSP